MTNGKTQWVREGATRLLVPQRISNDRPTGRAAVGPPRGPGTASGGAFYNPAMRFARDLSVLFTEARVQQAAARPRREALRRYRYLDALAATGARVVRIANEVRVPAGVVFEGVACDRDPRVVALLARNIARNRVAHKVAALCADAHRVVLEGAWDHVDVDPFGSPAPFLDSAVRYLTRGATLAVTATDTAALTGRAVAACRRRYDAQPWHGAGMHEAALRILAGAAVRAGVRHQVALRPVLAHATDHYVRIYLEASKGARRADAALEGLGYALRQADGTVGVVRSVMDIPRDAIQWSGPMWTGGLQDRDLVGSLTEQVGAHPRLEGRAVQKFLALADEESIGPPLHYEIGEIARAAGRGPPRMQRLLAVLREQGHTTTRCHTSPTGVKTNAPWPDLLTAAAEASRAS